MTKLRINQKKFLRRVKHAMLDDSKPLNVRAEYAKIYPQASQSTLNVNPYVLLDKPHAQKYLAELLNAEAPPNYISDRLKVLSNAKKDHVLPNGKIVEIRDNASSIASIDKILRITGALKDGDTNIDARSINFNMTADDAKILSDLADRLDRLENK